MQVPPGPVLPGLLCPQVAVGCCSPLPPAAGMTRRRCRPLDGQDEGLLSPAGHGEVGQKSTAARDFCCVLYITAESETGGYSSYCVPRRRRSLGRELNVGLVTSPAPGDTPVTDEGRGEVAAKRGAGPSFHRVLSCCAGGRPESRARNVFICVVLVWWAGGWCGLLAQFSAGDDVLRERLC